MSHSPERAHTRQRLPSLSLGKIETSLKSASVGATRFPSLEPKPVAA